MELLAPHLEQLRLGALAGQVEEVVVLRMPSRHSAVNILFFNSQQRPSQSPPGVQGLKYLQEFVDWLCHAKEFHNWVCHVHGWARLLKQVLIIVVCPAMDIAYIHGHTY